MTKKRLHALEFGLLSLILAPAVASIAHTRTPGWMLALWLGFWAGQHGIRLNIWLMLAMPVVVDGAIFFLILWGAYSVWIGCTRKITNRKPETGQ